MLSQAPVAERTSTTTRTAGRQGAGLVHHQRRRIAKDSPTHRRCGTHHTLPRGPRQTSTIATGAAATADTACARPAPPPPAPPTHWPTSHARHDYRQRQNHAAYRSANQTIGALRRPPAGPTAPDPGIGALLRGRRGAGCSRTQFAALTTPLRTGSPTARSTCSGSPVRTDSSSTATAASTRPSTGATSPGPAAGGPDHDLAQRDHRHFVTDPAPRETRRTLQRRPQIMRGTPLRRCIQRTPVDSMTAINAPATYSPTNSVPTNDDTTSRSPPPGPGATTRPPQHQGGHHRGQRARDPTPVGHRTPPDEPRRCRPAPAPPP